MAKEEKIKQLGIDDSDPRPISYSVNALFRTDEDSKPIFVSDSMESDRMCQVHRFKDGRFLLLGMDKLLMARIKYLDEKTKIARVCNSIIGSRTGFRSVVPHPIEGDQVLIVGEQHQLQLMKWTTDRNMSMVHLFNDIDYEMPRNASYFYTGELVCSFESKGGREDARVVLFDAAMKVKRTKGGGSFGDPRFSSAPICFAHDFGFVGVKEGVSNELKLFDSNLNQLVRVMKMPYSSREMGKFAVSEDGVIAYLLTGENGGSTITFFDPRKNNMPYGHVNMHNIITDGEFGLFEEYDMCRETRIVDVTFFNDALILLSQDSRLTYLKFGGGIRSLLKRR